MKHWWFWFSMGWSVGYLTRTCVRFLSERHRNRAELRELFRSIERAERR